MAEKKPAALGSNRASHEQMTYDISPVHEDFIEGDFVEQGLLDTQKIPPRPGFVQRWIRTSVHGEEDQSNIQKKINKGWRPRFLSTVPDGVFAMNIDFQGVDVVGIKGSMLMEMPEKLYQKYRKRVDDDTKLQLSAVTQHLDDVYDPSLGAVGRPGFIQHTQELTRGRRATIDD